MVNLWDAEEKLRWSRHHFETLRPQIEAFEQRDHHRFSVNVNRDTGEYAFSVHGLEVPDPDWGLMIGDCIHNARTALDYLVIRLWARVTGQDPADIADLQFPIEWPKIPDSAADADVDKAFAAARDRFKAFTAKVGKRPSFTGYLTRIEELQPYNSANLSIWGTDSGGLPVSSAIPSALQRLSALDNIDKHRVPHVAWTSIKTFGAPNISRFAPTDFKSIGGESTYLRLEDNAQFATWRFQTPLPSEWEPTQMEMQSAFPLEVAFGNPSPFQGVLEVLALSLWGVEAVLTIFEPVFRKAPQPPLPVTAIGEPRF
jgi:hypothetical protein